MALIQWYPGHMAKARREFQEKLKLVDVVYELVDARIPYSSQNPDLDKIIGDKPRVTIMMKADLADPKVSKEWMAYYRENHRLVTTLNAKDQRGLKSVIEQTELALSNYTANRKEKGLKERPIKAVSVGIPNVGKSTLINRFAGKNIAKTGNKPGVTQAQQWIKYKDKLELLDTPGILWPKFEDQEVGKKLALIGAIKDKLLYLDDIILFAMEYLVNHYPGVLSDRYKFDQKLEQELSMPDLLLEITSRRGFNEDYERAAEMMTHEIRKGILGKLSFERPEEVEEIE